MKRIAAVCTLTFMLQGSNTATGYELIWQGRLSDGMVDVRAPGLLQPLPQAIPARICQRRGFFDEECLFVLIEKDGTLSMPLGDRAHSWSAITDVHHIGWYLPLGAVRGDASPEHSKVLPGGHFSHCWQIGVDLYAMTSGETTRLFDAATGRTRMLTEDFGFEEAAMSKDGAVAITGRSGKGIMQIRVYDPAGEEIYRKVADDLREKFQFLYLHDEPHFLEFSRQDERFRVNLPTGAEHQIEPALPGARLFPSGYGIQIWSDSSSTVVVELAADASWRQLASYSRAHYCKVLPGGEYALSFASPYPGYADLIFYSSSGQTISAPVRMNYPTRIEAVAGGMVIVYCLSETCIFRREGEGSR